MTIEAYVSTLSFQKVKTFDIVKAKTKSGTVYLTIRINPTDELLSDTDITLWPDDDNFKDMDLENIPEQYKD